MSKITCIVLFTVAVSFGSVYATEEEKAAIREAIKPIITECSQEHGVSDEEIQSAKKAGSAEGIKPCFLGCVFKKAEIFNSKGEFDVDTGLTKLRKFVKNDSDFEKLSEIGKKCASVNEKPVGDEQAGCERATMLIACILEHKGEIPI